MERHHSWFSAHARQVLNVQVPFYFKTIVDSMNVDFTAIGGTAWTIGGAMIIACTRTHPLPGLFFLTPYKMELHA